MAVISMKALLESGVHFGHRTNKWDPRMKPYIFTERNGIHIIDLQQTSKLLNTAYNVIRDCVANGGTILFAADSDEQVAAWHAAGLANGGTCEGQPEPKPQARGAFGAYLRDPDGNKLAAYHGLNMG